MAPVSSVSGNAPNSGVGFCTTHWSVVLAAQEQATPAGREALAHLCSAYWAPLYAFVRRRGRSPEDAEDLTQEFFYQFLERHSLGHVHPEGGRFRSFLLVCLKNFLANEFERARAQRRGGGQRLISLNTPDAEALCPVEQGEELTPEMAYDRRWVFTVLQRALEELRRAYIAEQKGDLFEQLEGFLPGGHSGVSRIELAEKRRVSVGAIDVAIHRLRQRFGALLRAQVAETVASEAEVEGEIRHLLSVLGRC